MKHKMTADEVRIKSRYVAVERYPDGGYRVRLSVGGQCFGIVNGHFSKRDEAHWFAGCLATALKNLVLAELQYALKKASK